MGRRRIRVLVVAVVALAALYTAADRAAAYYADKEVTQLAAEKYGYADTTDGHLDVSVGGFPFLTQALTGDFGHVSLDATQFTLTTTDDQPGDYLHVSSLHLDLRDVRVVSLTSRSAEAGVVTGALTLGYQDLSDAFSRLSGGGQLTFSPAPGSAGQAARAAVTGRADNGEVNGDVTILAQGDEFSVRLPGSDHTAYTWSVNLPQGAGFTAADSTPTGVRLTVTGHQVALGASHLGG
ncbi:LmeA family phospholipid-binding protein [Phaeacidiphilus oryzae]|uniref:LmeA family phospholipid-binding protein n=1 Tax=Phaeacidiphilus oryzae TaxID=348818 RepID=UPI00056C4BCE|nr:DUF2993 domain-containing protein [Phaeacidiphilus oryzae]